MKVTTINSSGASFVLLLTEGGTETSLLMQPGETAADTLRRQAIEHRTQAGRLLARARACEAAADALLLSPTT